MRKQLFLLALILGMSTTILKAQEVEEITWYSFEEAVALNTENPKLIFIDVYTDWCGWCKRLNREVFSKSAFKKFSDKNLVLLQVDFPKKKKLPAEQLRANRELKRQYRVQGYPTVILITSSEKVVVETGYRRGGADKYVDFLREKLGKR